MTENVPSGLLLLNKPSGPTSHDMVDFVRRGTGIRRVGHTGTLDPLASGVLVLCLGAATRLSEYLVGEDKQYRAVVRFGSATDTFDAAGTVTRQAPVSFDADRLAGALAGLRGELDQTPPPHSAIKVRGRKAYELARGGEAVNLPPRKITIYALELLDWSPPDATLDIHCSSGTYVRSLADALGPPLGSAAHLARLTRSRAGRFCLEQSVTQETLRLAFADGTWSALLIPLAEALLDLPAVVLNRKEVQTLERGGRIPAAEAKPGMARALAPDGRLIAIVEWVESSRAYQPRKVFSTGDEV